MRKPLALATIALGLAWLAPQLADAASCRTGCGAANRVCVRAGTYKKIGCTLACYHAYDTDPCHEVGDCTPAAAVRNACKEACVAAGIADRAACRADRATCDTTCSAASDQACADTCGISYKQCLSTPSVLAAGKACRAACCQMVGKCLANGGCIQGCAAFPLLDRHATCTSAFDTCMPGCS